MAKARKFGKAEVEVSIADRVGAGLAAIEKRLKTFGTSIQTIGTRVGLVGAGISAAGGSILAPITAAVHQFAAAGDALDKMAGRTGVSVAALQELGFAAEQGGADLATVEMGLKGISQFLFRARNGSNEAAAALQKMGLSVAALQGLSPEQQFMRIAESLSEVEDASLRGALAQTVFEESGRKLLPMLNGLQDIRDEAQELGLVLSKDATKDAAALTDALNRIRRTVGGAFLQLGAAVAQPVLRALEVITSVTSAVSKWVAENHQVIRTVAMIGGVLLVAGAAATTLGVTAVGIGVAIASIGTIAVTAFGALSAAVAFLLSPIGLLVAGLTAIGTYMAVASRTGQTVLGVFGQLGSTIGGAFRGIASAISQGNFAEALNIAAAAAQQMLQVVIDGINAIFPGFDQLASVAVETWNTIVGAVREGMLEQAAQLAFTALQVAYEYVVLQMRQAWNDAVFYLQDRWADVVEFIVGLGSTIYTTVAGVFDQLGAALADGFDVAFTSIRGIIDNIVTAIAKAIISAQEFFGLFSQDEADQVRQGLDDELARRGADRQRAQSGRINARAAGVAARAGERQSLADAFGQALSQTIRPTEQTADDSRFRDAQQRLADQQRALAEAVAAAEESRTENPDRKLIEDLVMPQMQQAGNNVQAIGTSSAAAVAAGALGFSTRPMEDTATNTRELVRLAKTAQRRPPQIGLT